MRIEAIHSGRCCALVLALGSVLHAAPPPVTFDGSLGARGSRSGTNMIIPASRGRVVGSNLFHSFGRLDVPADSAVRFQGPGKVNRVLARVTGGRASRIDGTLACDIPSASLFLFNPNGVIFGPGAQVDVGGSFVVSTANQVGLADGGRFTTSAIGDDLLTTAAPESFGFVGPAAGVFVNGSTLRLAPGKPHAVAAGEVRISGGRLVAPGGKLTIVGTNGSGTVTGGANPTADPSIARNDVSVIDHSELSVAGAGGGTLRVQARHLDIDRGTLTARTGSQNSSGGIDVNLTGDLTLRAGRIETGTDGDGNAGPVNVSARAIELVGVDWRPVKVPAGIDTASGSRDSTNPHRVDGRAGDVRVAADTLRILDGAAIDTATYTRGNGGDIQVTVRGDAYFSNEAGVLKSEPFNAVDDPLDFRDTGVIARTYGAFAGAGNGGNVELSAANLTLGASGVVTTSTRALGNAGDVRVTVAEHIQITTPPDRPDGSTASGGILSQTLPESTASPEAGGGGSVHVRAWSIDIFGERGGGIAATTRGNGDAGSVLIEAGDVTVRGPQGTIQAASLRTPQFHPVIDGRAGAVELRVRSLRVVDGADVSVSATSLGSAGQLDISAAETVEVSNGGELSVATSGRGSAGQLKVSAANVEVSGGRVTTSSEGDGPTGGITLRVRERLVVNAGEIAATASQTDGGDVAVVAGALEIDGGGEITASAFGDGGNLTLVAPDLSLRNAAVLSAEAGSTADASVTPAANGATAPGNGGNVTIIGLPQRRDSLLFAENSEINASAPGRGGRITISALNQVLVNTEPVASGGVTGDEGTIDVTSTQTDLTGSLVPLNAALRSPLAQLHDACASMIGRDLSSFVELGSGGLPLDPGSWLTTEFGLDPRQPPPKRP